MNRLLMALLGGLYREGETGGEGGAGTGTGTGTGTGAADDKGGTGTGDGGTGDGKGGADDKGAEGNEGKGAAGAESLALEAKRLAEGATSTAIPDKYIVKGADGKAIDHEKTLANVDKARRELETRMGATGGLAPEKADDYKLELAQGEAALPKLDEKMAAAFRATAKASNLNQKQYNEMVRAGNAMIAEVVKGLNLPDGQAARVSLVKHYGGEAQYKEAAARAYQGFAAFADATDLAEIDTIGDNPVFIRVFDRIAAELGEEKLPRFNSSAMASEDAEIERLQKDVKSEYWDPKKPGHAAAVAKVTAWHERKTQASNSRFAKA